MLRLLTELTASGIPTNMPLIQLFVTGMANFGYVLLCRDPHYAMRLAAQLARQIGLRLREEVAKVSCWFPLPIRETTGSGNTLSLHGDWFARRVLSTAFLSLK